MPAETVITIIFLLLIVYLCTRGEKKQLEDQLEFQKALTKYNGSSQRERIAQLREWLDRYDELSERLSKERIAAREKYNERDKGVSGKVLNKLGEYTSERVFGAEISRGLGAENLEELELSKVGGLLKSVQLPNGLTNAECVRLVEITGRDLPHFYEKSPGTEMNIGQS